jgi:hypothetical protein
MSFDQGLLVNDGKHQVRHDPILIALAVWAEISQYFRDFGSLNNAVQSTREARRGRYEGKPNILEIEVCQHFAGWNYD